MKRALIVYGGWEGHEPRPTSELFADELARLGLSVTLSDTLDTFQQVDHLREFSVIIPNWTMGTLTKEQEKGLRSAVAGGVGLAGFHGGMGDAFRSNPTYQYMVGGQFVAHPDNHKDYSVQILPSGDPITRGLADFTVHSEQYYLHVDPSNVVLATTTFQSESNPWINGCVMPVAWKRHFGSGRIFYTSIGHDRQVFAIPQARQLALRGMLWAAGLL